MYLGTMLGTGIEDNPFTKPLAAYHKVHCDVRSLQLGLVANTLLMYYSLAATKPLWIGLIFLLFWQDLLKIAEGL